MHNVKHFFQHKWQDHKTLLALAFPLILGNITTPLLGLVDTAILGNMSEVAMLSGAAIGSIIVTQIYWICGFLRMSVTGLSAQSISAETVVKQKVLVQSCAVAFSLAILALVAHQGILDAGIYLAGAEASHALYAKQYFETRIWGAPAAMLNMVLMGWLIGQQKTKKVLLLQLIINLTNILMSVFFVYALDLGIRGVAGATVFAEYLTLVIGLVMIKTTLSGQSSIKLTLIVNWLSWGQIKNILSLNHYIFIRNLVLQATLAFITFKGAHYGVLAVAVNAIIMQFFALIALGLDGIANAAEALVGEAKGEKNQAKLNNWIALGFVWSSIFAVFYALTFVMLDSLVIDLLTHHERVKDALQRYSLIIYSLPLVAHWCFLLDGVFVGISKGKDMQNTMILSSLCGFFPTWYLFSSHQNVALWLAMLVFCGFRGMFLYWRLRKHRQNNTLLST